MPQETITANEILRQSLDRNRYFYGMLMTVRDFTMEQEYFTAKRLVINRLLFGSGVICGLRVEKSASHPTTIVISPGVALDPLGREITVPEVNGEANGGTKRDLAGVIPARESGTATGFICLSHLECRKAPMPAPNSSGCDETCEASRWSETFEVTWDANGDATTQPSLCEKWLNRRTVANENAAFRVERTTPVWVKTDEVFEVVVRVTAKQNANNIRIAETRTGGTLIEPAPPTSGAGQFPAPPVNLKTDEFFVYVYQVKAPGAAGSFELNGATTGLPALKSTIDVVNEANAKLRENELTIETNCGEPSERCIRIAQLTAHFTAGALVNISDIKNLGAPRFRYSLERVTEMLDCVRASLLAEPGSARPGHALITFNDLETTDPRPIGKTASPGNSFTVARGDHVHKLILREPGSGLQFTGAENNELWINGDVGGSAIKFLNTVKGKNPVEAQDLVTKEYVDATVSGLDWQESVLSKDVSSPPTAAAGGSETTVKPLETGDRYLLLSDSLSGVWAKHKNHIATFKTQAWAYTTPNEGMATFVEDVNTAYLFVDGNWIPFLAAPEVTAGKGLKANGAILSVGPGKGIVVNENDVAVAFDVNPPPPIGPASLAGTDDATARSNHTHRLVLATNSGLQFENGALRIDGTVAGSTVDFQRAVSGQPPTLDRHLTTKKYVDEKVAEPTTVIAGRGLVSTDRTISVGPGDGILIGEHSVAAHFSDAVPLADTQKGDAGRKTAVARVDHSHPLPSITTGATTGVVFFAPPSGKKRFTTLSEPIDPGLQSGIISVQLAFIDPAAKDTYSFAFVMAGLFPVPGVPNLNMVAKVKLGSPTTFQIGIDMAVGEQELLPATIQIRWFAYLPVSRDGIRGGPDVIPEI